jgi:hypothetical protein
MHVNTPPPPPRSIRAGVPKQLEAAIMKALAKAPDDRFRNADEMKDALLSTASGAARTATFATPQPRIDPTPSGPSGDVRWIVAALGLIALAIAAAMIFSTAQDSPTTGDEPGRGDSTVAGAGIEVKAADDFDPHGGGEEHSEQVGLAFDGNPSTAWNTEGYNSSLQALNKAGVGLVFDLGGSVSVDRVVLKGSADMTVELRATDQTGADENSFELIDEKTTAGTTTFDVGGQSARYWLLWITSLPGGGGGSGSIAEVEFFGS